MSVRRWGATGRGEGFTIVELLIVFLILGILVSMVMMSMLISKGRAQDASCKANIRIVDGAVQQYMSVHAGGIPPELDILTEQGYLKENFNWTCPSGDFGEMSGDYRDYYDPSTGQTSCPRPNHKL